MSRQHNLTKSMIKSRGFLQRRSSRDRPLNGYIINLDENSIEQDSPTQTCIHISDKQDEVVIHLRVFRNGCPTPKGVNFNWDAWNNLITMVPEIDTYIKSFKGSKMETKLFELDVERSVTVLTAQAQVVFQCGKPYIVLSFEQWLKFVTQMDEIRRKTLEHRAKVMASAEGQK